MDSDVEMLEQKSVSALLTPGSPLAHPPTDSQQVSPIVAPEVDDSGTSVPPDILIAPPPTTTTATKVDSKGKGKPVSAKPPAKSTKARAKSPSPSPPPAVPPPPLQTIRLDIKLGGPENYEVDVAKLAKETGQRPATPPPAAVKPSQYESESEGEGAQESGVGTDGEKRGKKVRNRRAWKARFFLV